MSTFVKFRGTSRSLILTDSMILSDEGGEGTIYILPSQTELAKIYRKSDLYKQEKLKIMLKNPPIFKKSGHIFITWCSALLEDKNGLVIGYVMPRLSKEMLIIENFCDPRSRLENNPDFNYKYLLRTAKNYASLIKTLHSQNYVIGDIHESNIMVNKSALVTIIDTDSFQITDPITKQIYRGGVGKEEYTPQELQGKSLASVNRKKEHDLFGMAVIIFQLLMEYIHPFMGVYQTSGDAPGYGERIKEGHFIFCTTKKFPITPPPQTPPFTMLHPIIQKLFIQCFEYGHINPLARPSADDWCNALEIAERDLRQCAANSQHFYGKHLSNCPWCKLASATKLDHFPTRVQVKNTLKLFSRKKNIPQRPKPTYNLPITPQYQPIPVNTNVNPTIPSITPTKNNAPLSREAKEWLYYSIFFFAIFGIGGILLYYYFGGNSNNGRSDPYPTPINTENSVISANKSNVTNAVNSEVNKKIQSNISLSNSNTKLSDEFNKNESNKNVSEENLNRKPNQVNAKQQPDLTPTPFVGWEEDEKGAKNKTQSNANSNNSRSEVVKSITIIICPLSGLRATANCPEKEAKTFTNGTEPKDFCSFHNKSQ